jgi:hypothetical protein
MDWLLTKEIKNLMRNTNLKALIATLSIFFAAHAYSQGCSDAGFCTLTGFKPASPTAPGSFKNWFKAGFSYGKADHSISVFGTYLEWGRQVNSKVAINARLTALSQSGNDISVFAPSDVFLSSDYKINNSTGFTAGIKIPLNSGNRARNGLSLPLDYQSSIGTLDLIIGMAHDIKRLRLTAALQQPITQNKNRFMASDHPSSSALSTFQSTNKFKRAGDILLRVSYPLKAGTRLTITPALLPIYHLSNDKFTDMDGVEKEIEGSNGLTLNGNIFLDYMISNRNTLQLSYGSPLTSRDIRPDGLTRSFVINLEYKISF